MTTMQESRARAPCDRHYFFADLLQVPADPFDHGFVRARRREDQILGVQVVSWRLAQNGLSYMVSLKDLFERVRLW